MQAEWPEEMLHDGDESDRQAWIDDAENYVRTLMFPAQRVPHNHQVRTWDEADAATVEESARAISRTAIAAAMRLKNTAARSGDRTTAKKAELFAKRIRQASRNPQYGVVTPDQWLEVGEAVEQALSWLSDDSFNAEQTQHLRHLTEVRTARRAALEEVAEQLLLQAIEDEKARRAADGAWVEELRRRADVEHLASSDADDKAFGETPMYESVNGCLRWNKPVSDGGTIPVVLAHFDAEITEQITRDDGTERAILWQLHVTGSDGHEGDVQIPPEQLGRPQQWATKAIGMSALVMPGMAISDHLRVAVHSRSRKATRRTVYVHTGWRQIEGTWRYLTATGALGADGMDTSVSVDLGPLNAFALPDVREVRTVRSLRQEVVASTELFKLAKDERALVPMMCATYRAVLPLAPDCSVWVFGRSGTFKTATTALAQQHFGPAMNAQALPANWTSTANSLEQRGHLLANALMVIDDYSPDASESDAKRRAAAADRLMRGSANQAGRGRLRSDGTPQVDKPPRAQMLTSAEDVPPAIGSLRARVFVTEIAPGSIDAAKLAKAQKQAEDGTFAAALADYVQWLATQLDNDPQFRNTLSEKRDRLRDEAKADGQHPRTALNVASLALGWGQWLEYAAEVGAIDGTTREELWAQGWKALVDLGAEQEKYSRDADPVVRYLGAVNALVLSRKAYFAGAASEQPSDPARWGWSRSENTGTYVVAPSAVRLGFVDDRDENGDLYLIPAAAYGAARRFAEDQGSSLGVTMRAIHKALDERGLLVSRESPKRYTAKKTIGGRKVDVIHLSLSTFEGLAAE